MKSRSGATIDISLLPGPEARSHDFVRLEELRDGWFAIVNPEKAVGLRCAGTLPCFLFLVIGNYFTAGRITPGMV